MLSSFGIEDTSTKLLINGGLTLWGLGWAITWSLSIEYVGRRKLFLTAMAGMFCAWTALTALAGVNSAHDNEDTALSIASVVMVFMHVAFYKMAGPTQDPYFMEISPYGLRAKTAVIKSFGDASANLFSSFVNPIGIEHIGWKYYIVWCVVLVSNFVIIYLFFPEVSLHSIPVYGLEANKDST
jgi:MFS family permease